MKPMLSAENVVKVFGVPNSPHAITALSDVSIDVFSGETVGLVGESGSGKTTISRIMMGIETATKGVVLRDGRRVETKADWKELRRNIQYVFQDPYTALCPTMRVGAALAEPLIVHKKCPRSECSDRVAEMLKKVGLHPDVMRRLPIHLSGGQRQRVSLARALMLEPNVLICDEIVSGLDVSIQAQVLQLLINLQSELGISIVFISHDLRVVRYMCDRVYVMYNGEVIEAGETSNVFNTPSHQYTKSLLAAIPGVVRNSSVDIG
ncbi:MAG: ATP-binding cassette domain-containing protein [Planktomarina sp.]|nr:ATP-binding cassette domain-containing protein [Planktomarina sp.]